MSLLLHVFKKNVYRFFKIQKPILKNRQKGNKSYCYFHRASSLINFLIEKLAYNNLVCNKIAVYNNHPAAQEALIKNAKLSIII